VPSWRVPLADVRVSEEEIAALGDTYRSGWLSMGPETERLESAFAAYAGVRHACATANGTASLHLILAAAGLGPGDEVIVPSMTFVATANAIRYTGARPVFADIASPVEPWITPETVEPLIGPRTKAVLTLPYGGHPGATKALAGLARSRGLQLLIDAAHAVEAQVENRHVAALGLASAFSFFSNKNLAVGEGGMVVTDDDDLAATVRLLRSHGMTTLTWDRHRGHASGYDVLALGFNYRIDEPRATLARLRLDAIEKGRKARATAVEHYRHTFADLAGLELLAPPVPADTAAHHLFPIVLSPDIHRDAFRSSLAEAGVQTSVHYPPVHRFSIYADSRKELPTTEAYGARTVTLPLFAHITEGQLRTVVDAVKAGLTAGAKAVQA
jgi:dTDP-4-amino-4,6-dideoxygalactose transaminase